MKKIIAQHMYIRYVITVFTSSMQGFSLMSPLAYNNIITFISTPVTVKLGCCIVQGGPNLEHWSLHSWLSWGQLSAVNCDYLSNTNLLPQTIHYFLHQPRNVNALVIPLNTVHRLHVRRVPTSYRHLVRLQLPTQSFTQLHMHAMRHTHVPITVECSFGRLFPCDRLMCC